VIDTAELEVLRVGFGVEPFLDRVAEEVPVAIEYNGISYAVMLATPTELEDFAYGFSLAEGIVSRCQEIYDVEIESSADGVILHVEIASAAFANFKGRRRNMAGRTGCGLCGIESLAQLKRHLAPVISNKRFPLVALLDGMRRLPNFQYLQQSTGATHAACWVDYNGVPTAVREDVGRHNALDKTLGALARCAISPESGAVLITSRASFEMVQKAASLGIGLLAAVSAPTMAAVRLADELGLTLLGFLREGRAVIYSHPGRIDLSGVGAFDCLQLPSLECAK
jgi:FdhD protein